MWEHLGNALMMGVGFALVYLAVAKRYEPLLLLPIGFGAILANVPYANLGDPGGMLHTLRVYGIENELLPALLFIGIGAMDGPTAIFVAQRFAPHLLGPITVCAYSYMSLVPLLQIPLSRLLISEKERKIVMEYAPGELPWVVRVVFPIAVFLVVALIAPQGTLLIGTLMLGNLMRESGVVKRLTDAAENELSNLVTLFLGLTIGGTMTAEAFLNVSTLYVFGLGLVAFVIAIASGLVFAKIASAATGGRINPLIGACGVSAFPMAARTAHLIGRQDDPENWLLPHALATNIGGQIASVVAGSAILTYAPRVLTFLGA